MRIEENQGVGLGSGSCWPDSSEPLVLVLLIAAIVGDATGDWPSAAIVFVIVAASILLDILQEHKAERTIEARNPGAPMLR